MEIALTPDLAVGFLFTAVVGTLLGSRVLGVRFALPIAAFKSGLVTLYFVAFYDRTWNIIDDITYWQESIRLLELGYTPITILSSIHELKAIAGGRHILYYWWNMVSMSVLGHHYYSPVFFNVILTFVAGLALVAILDRLDYDSTYRKWCFGFFLLHWDVLAWTTTLNVKDTLVLTLTVIVLYGFIRILDEPLSKRDTVFGAMYVAGSFFLLWWIRFYVLFLVLVAVGGWAFFHLRPRVRYALLGVGLIPIPILIRRGLWALDMLQFSTWPYGIVRFVLTPRPWGINEAYTFLVVPSFLHWMAIAFAAVGALYVNRTSKLGRLLLAYLLVIVVFYGAVPRLQGPRHRYQIVPILAWVQFHFIWIIKEHVRFYRTTRTNERRSHQ